LILFKAVTKLLFALADGVLVISRDEQAETAFSPESRVFAVRNPGRIRLWQLERVPLW
jgi:hypothetical protein